MKYSKEEREMWLQDWKQSGKSAWAYAKENSLTPQTFVRWTKSGTKSDPCFVEVPAPFIQTQMAIREILIEKGEVKIHIPLSYGRDELRAIIESLGLGL